MSRKKRIPLDEQYRTILDQLRKRPRPAADVLIPELSLNTIEKRITELMRLKRVRIVGHEKRRGTYARVYAPGRGKNAQRPYLSPGPHKKMEKRDPYSIPRETKDMLMALDYFTHAVVKRRASA